MQNFLILKYLKANFNNMRYNYLILISLLLTPITIFAQNNEILIEEELFPSMPFQIDWGKARLENLNELLQEFYNTIYELDKINILFMNSYHEFILNLNTTRNLKEAPPKGWPCSFSKIAFLFATAKSAGKKYLENGNRLKMIYDHLNMFLNYSEVDQLIPSDRRNLEKIETIFNSKLRVYEEMRQLFHNQMEWELKNYGCNLTEVNKLGIKIAEEENLTNSNSTEQKEVLKEITQKVQALSEIRLSVGSTTTKTVTFLVNNTKCKKDMVIYLDGVEIGMVEGNNKKTFNSSEGWHKLCVIPKSIYNSYEELCENKGKSIKVNIFEGWEIRPKC